MQSSAIKIFISIIFIYTISGCGSHKAESPEPIQTEQAKSDESIAPEMIQEYAMIHQISDLEKAEFYLRNPDYAKEHPYHPTSEDLAFFERKFFERVYPNFEKLAEQRGFTHARGAYRGINPHDKKVGRSWKRKYMVDQTFKKTEKVNTELERATKLYNAGKFDEAVEHMKIAVEADPGSPTLLYNLGVMQMKVGGYSDAASNFEKSISILQDSSYTNVNMAIHPKIFMGSATSLGLAYINLGRHEEAVEILKEAIEFGPDDLDANWNLGVAYWYMADIENTTSQLRKYINLDPKNAEARNIIGLAYYSEGLHNAALDEFQRAAKLNPEEKQYSYNEGLTLARMGRYDEASEAFQRASGLLSGAELRRIFGEQLSANKVKKLYNDGCAAMEKFDSTRAIELFNAALELDPDMLEAHVNLGELYGMRGSRRKQVHHLKEAVRLKSDMANVRYSLGLAYFDSRMYSEAISELEQTIQLDPSISGAHFKLGMVLCKAQNYGEAIPRFEKALELEPGWFEAHLNLGTCYLKTGNTNSAIENFEKSIQLKPKSAEAHYCLGEAYIRIEDFDKTSEFFQKALAINPGHKQAQARLRELENYQGKAVD